MGVRGLTSFFDHNPVLSKDYKLRNCPVIIDGNNLVHYLYFGCKLDCVYGGDYYRFAEEIEKHISLYLACNIKPIVVFDGGYDASDRKLATVLQRTRQRLTNAQHIAKYSCCSGKVLPILAVEVMKSVLQNLDVTSIQSDYEADDEMMLLANRWKCPVISQDSDFYIFDVACGFIRLDSIANSISQEVDDNDDEIKYLKCKIYQIDDFVALFPGIDKSLLPLFSTLVGNDFVHIDTFDDFYANIRLPKFKGKLKISQRHKKILGLLTWLQYRTVEDAIEQVLNHIKLKKRDQICVQIKDAMKSYMGQSFLNLEGSEDDEKLCLMNNFKTFKEKSVPPWFIEGIRCGRISPFLLNAICLHRNFLPSQVEDMSLESSYNCSRYIRQVIYSILLTYDVSPDDALSDSSVDEYDRRGGSLKKESLSMLSHIEGYGPVPHLQYLDALDISSRTNVILKVLGDDLEYFSTIPEKFQLLFGGIRYWLRNCQPKPSEEVFVAFTLSVLYFAIVWPIIRGDADKASVVLSSNSDLNSLIKSIEQVNAVSFHTSMKKYSKKPQHNNAKPIIFRHIHHFCQLQACLLFLMYLNKLLQDPFLNVNLFECFNGTIVYNLTKELLTRPSMDLFVSTLLGRTSSLEILYSEIKSKILQNMSEGCPIKSEYQKKIGKKKNKKCLKEDITPNMHKLSAYLEFKEELNLECSADSDVDVFL